MAEVLLRLSSQLDAAIPQLLLFAVVRKLTRSFFGVLEFAASCSHIWQHERALSFRRHYAYVELKIDQAWAVCYIALISYVVVDFASNIDDFLNCREHRVPRPIGIYCAIALTCFVFTTKLSVSTMSVLVMVCAKDMNTITGLACIINFSVWAGIKGTSVAMATSAILSALKFAFCGHSSSAALCLANLSWLSVWGWLAVISSASTAFRTVEVVRKDN